MKKNIFKWLTMMMVALVSVGFVACGDDDDDNKGGNNSKIVGTWSFYSSEDEGDVEIIAVKSVDYEEIIFKSDNTFEVWEWLDKSPKAADADYTQWVKIGSGRYTYSDNNKVLTVYTEGGTETMTVKFEGDKLIFDYGDGEIDTFVKGSRR